MPARAQVAADRAAGYRIVMATASYRCYARAIAERLGFDAVIGTQATRADRRIVARISGDNCYGAVKLRMLRAWMKREGIAREAAEVRFYSDHVSDAPTLAWADQAFAVHPHAALRALAAEHGGRCRNGRDEARCASAARSTSARSRPGAKSVACRHGKSPLLYSG